MISSNVDLAHHFFNSSAEFKGEPGVKNASKFAFLIVGLSLTKSIDLYSSYFSKEVISQCETLNCKASFFSVLRGLPLTALTPAAKIGAM